MLESVRVQRFKSISDATVSLGRVTLLVGPNNAGKSSILHAIQFSVSVAQSLRLDNVATWAGDTLSGTLSSQQLVYTPLRDVHALAAGGNLRQDANQAISVTLTTADLGTTNVQVRRGKNKNISVTITGAQLGRRMESLDQPYSVVAPGLAGIPAFEEYRSPGLVQRAAAKGDANGVFRNVLWLLNQRPDAWNEFSYRLQKIFPDLRIEVSFNADVDEVIQAFAVREDTSLPIDSCGTGVLQAIQTLAYIGLYKPQVLILDEPDSHLHPDNQRRLARLLDDVTRETGLQVVISTHSRHFLDEFSPLGATIRWLSGGSVQQDDTDRVSVLLGLGALDAGDRLRNGETPLVVLTEDAHTDNLRTVLQASGLGADVCDVWSYAGCSNIQSAKVLGTFIRQHAPGTRVIVHRDRDYMTDAEVDDYKRQLRDAHLESFVTEGTDMECYLLNASHIHDLANELSLQQIEVMINEATAESRDLSIERFTNHRHNAAVRTRNRGGSEPNVGRISREAMEAYDADPVRYRYGKRVQGLLKAKVQQALGRNVEHCQVTNALSVSELREIADQIPRQ